MEAFFEDATLSSAQLSPDGRYLAIVQGGTTPAVTVTDLKTRQTTPILPLMSKGALVRGLSADWIRWKSNDRLIVGLTLFDIRRQGDRPDGQITGWRFGRFMMAVDRDGQNQVQLLKGGFWNSERGSLVSLLDRLRADPDHILAIAPRASGWPAVWKVNIKTGDAEMVESGDADTDGWGTDAAGTVVSRVRVVGNVSYLEGRAPGQSQWTTIVKLKPKDVKVLDDFDLLKAAEKPGQAYVAVKPKDKSEGDTRRLRIYDFTTKKLSDPLWPELKYDIEDVVTDEDTGALRGVCYTAEVYTCDFSDPVIQANFKGISKFFDGDRSLTPISITADAHWWLFDVSGPDEPSSYYLFDWQTKRIELLAEQFKSLTSDRLAERRRWSYAARDGVMLSGYLTRPRGAPETGMPLIVLPHGGPEGRDSFSYDPWSQYLATRGYLVFQPNFRGSGGFGRSFAEAGYGQWGGRMADDVTDGVRKLIESGQADPNRICIFGGSYGGYAALFAGATHPELYKCVVSRAGDADLFTSLKYERSFGKETPRYQYWLKSIGDPDTQQDALRKASPVTYADSYKPPVLLIHGADDDIVPVQQSRQMEQALKKAGKDVRLIVYKDEGHSEWDTRDDESALREIGTFIKAHIAPWTPGPPVAVKTAASPAQPTAATAPGRN